MINIIVFWMKLAQCQINKRGDRITITNQING